MSTRLPDDPKRSALPSSRGEADSSTHASVTDESSGAMDGEGNDAIIGVAFRWSLVILGLFLVGAILSVYWVKFRSPATPTKVTQITPPVLPEISTAEIPSVRFVDITDEAGIRFVHHNGAYGDKLLPETMGGGCAFFDFDNDGHQDLLFVNSTEWPWRRQEGKPAPTMALYRNDGTGHFTDVTAGSGLDVSFYGMGVAIGDFDNDGRSDVFITGVGGSRLFRNLGGGKFEDVTERARVGGSQKNWSTSAAWVDYDNDGDLDLFVCNYVQWSREIDIEVDYKLVGIGRAYGPPMNFPGSFPYLYRNDGQGRFTDVSATSGVQVKSPATGLPMAKSLGVAVTDLNNDGWFDLIVANDTVQNFVFINQRNGTFKESGATYGIAFDLYGGTRGAMGIDCSRIQNDDNLAVAIGNFANEMTALYVSQNLPHKNTVVFTDEAITQGIGVASRRSLTFGVFFFDYDLDGWQDLLTTNGHIEEEIGKIQESQQYAQPAQLFWNAHGSRRGHGFVPVSAEKCGADLFKPIVGRGSAFADIDGDGDLDVVMTQVGGRPILLRNEQAGNRRWARLKLVGTKSNRDAIGAWVKARVGKVTHVRQVMPTRGYLSQSELPVTIGLDQADQIDELTVIWPDGSIQQQSNIKAGKVTVITQTR